jgi:hypothetical protein
MMRLATRPFELPLVIAATASERDLQPKERLLHIPGTFRGRVARFSIASAENQQEIRNLALVCCCSITYVYLIGRSIINQIAKRLDVHPKPDPPLPSGG